MRIAHVITGLEVGGAERLLAELAFYGSSRGVNSLVIGLRGPGPVGEELRQRGLEVVSLGFGGSALPLAGVGSLTRLLRQWRPDCVHCWLYHGNLAGGVAARLARIPAVWSLHTADLSPAAMKPRTMRTAVTGARFARRLARAIACCSESARSAHVRLGYPETLMRVIPNGVDTSRFTPDHAARALVRDELGMSPTTPLVGHIARWHPQKGHDVVSRAAAIVLRRVPAARFLACGSGTADADARLAPVWEAAGCRHALIGLGLRRDIPRITAALDASVVASTSGEAMPLVIAEAMATGVPVVASDIGDSRLMVATAGMIVPPGDTTALADAITRVLTADATGIARMSRAGTMSARAEYSLGRCWERYRDLYPVALQAAGDR